MNGWTDDRTNYDKNGNKERLKSGEGINTDLCKIIYE